MSYAIIAVVALFMAAEARPASPDTANAVKQYSDCTIRGASELDDGDADPIPTARRVAAQCEAFYRDWLEAVRGEFFLPGDRIPTNLELALQTVSKQREIWQRSGISGVGTR